jgi:tRNA threonylcarbamoyladenosine biosynthesis protein TsaB
MILVVETSSAACSIALIEGAETIAERHEIVGRGHAERLLVLIADLLAGARPDSILVDVGPGSFTGIRVGLAAAQGLRIGWGVGLAGFSSMSLLAAPAGGEAAIAIAGGHGQLFVQHFAHDPLVPLDSLRALTPEAAAAIVGTRRVIGSGAPALVAARGFGEAVDRLPRAADARLLPEALRVLEPRPIYGRPPDAKPMA